MPDVIDFVPLYVETLPRVRARMDADANAGLTPDDPAWIDTREGTFYWDITQVVALECARIWDAIGTETVAAAFPSSAWGEYLDEHAATFNLTRNPAQPSTGEVLFIAAPGTLIAQTTQVSADPTDPTLDPQTFTTTESGTTSSSLGIVQNVVTTPATTGGVLAAGVYYYHVTAYNEYGESLGSPDVSATTTGTTGRVTITWNAIVGALGYRVYRAVMPNSSGGLLVDTNSLSFTDHGDIIPGVLEPTQDTSSGVILPVTALVPGKAGDLAANAITNLDTLIPNVTQVTNQAPTVGGEDVEDDDALRLRILSQYSAQGGGNQHDYVKWALGFVGVERADCVPVWNGPQTVLVVPMLSDGSAVGADVVTGLQQYLDPVGGQGLGQAPIGAIVTVMTTTALHMTIVGTLTFTTGFTLDGAGGTVATRAEIQDALNTYLMSLNPGDVISYQQIQAQILSVDGVQRVNTLTVNGGTADITLTVNPPEYAVLSTLTLS